MKKSSCRIMLIRNIRYYNILFHKRLMTSPEKLGNELYIKGKSMIQKKEYAELYKELEVLEDHGIHIILEGVPVSAFQAVQAHMIREVGSYMRDYILDSDGHLKEITFNDIR